MKFFIPILLLVIIAYVSSIEDVIAYTVNFPVNNHRVTRIPTYCGIEPDPFGVSSQIVNFWMDEAEKSVSDWKIMLGNANSEHRERWEMKYVTVPEASNITQQAATFRSISKTNQNRRIRFHILDIFKII